MNRDGLNTTYACNQADMDSNAHMNIGAVNGDILFNMDTSSVYMFDEDVGTWKEL